MTTAGLLLAALCCCGGAALISLLTPRRWPAARGLAFAVLAAGSVALAVAGFRAVLGHGGTLDLGSALGFGQAMLRTDPLSGLFLALTGAVATPVMLVFWSWSRGDADVPFRSLPALAALTVAGVIVVLTADNGFVFLFGWETVSIAFYLLSAYRRDRASSARAGMLTFTFSKVSGALLLIAFALLAGQAGSFSFAAWTDTTGATQAAAYALALVAFTAKVGVVPLQVWLPSGYAAAPGPARALMSAVAANIGFYGMWRTLGVLGKPPTWIVVILLLAASFTALLGIAHAAVQRDLQRVIAYSSVENGGLITAGFGIALAGTVAELPRLVALGLLASALQMVTHAFAKSSLFLASARIEQRTGATDLDELLGAGRDEPTVGAAFGIGALTLAGLPLTIGFVSEWFLLESIMQLFRVEQLTLQLTLAVTGAALALTAGYAGFTFVRLVGLTMLGGSARIARTPLAGLRRLGVAGTVGLLAPAAVCVGLAALTPWEIRFLARGLAPLIPREATLDALASPWVLQPVFPGFSILSPSWLALALPLMFLLVLGVTVLASGGSLFAVRRVPAWRSATGGVSGDARYTAFAFANPTRHVLGNLLLTRAGHVEAERETREEEDAETAFTGPDMPAGEEPPRPDGRGSSAGIGAGPARDARSPVGAPAHHTVYTTDVVELVETFLYRPLLGPLRRLVSRVKRLQSGRLDAYVSYLLITLVALLAVVVAFA
jgi:formate hydrogenlyase subunit 3/multisubunit Na+/H+ antiporter MnhD subunit